MKPGRRDLGAGRIAAVAAFAFVFGDLASARAGPLHDAASAGNVDLVQSILKEDPSSVDGVDLHGETALHVAARQARTAVAAALLAAGANARATAPGGVTPLHCAALARDHEAVAGKLKRLGIDLTDLARQSEQGRDPVLSTSAANAIGEDFFDSLFAGTELSAEREADHGAVVRMLIAAGADVNAPSSEGPPLCNAARSHGKDILLALLAAGADATARCQELDSPLSRFLMSGRREDTADAVEHLAAGGADVNARERDGTTPLGISCARRDLPASRALIRRGANVNAASVGQNPVLFWAVGRRDVEMLRLLAAAGADLAVKDRDGWTALNRAVAGGSREIVETLLAAGANVNAKDKEGFSPLMTAAERGNSGMVDTLLAAHADVGTRTAEGESALSRAVDFRHDAIVRALLAAGADPRREIRRIGTVLHSAAINGDATVVRTLIAHGAQVDDARADFGQTPLHCVGIGEPEGTKLPPASPEQRIETARALLEHGANLEARQVEGYTPLFLAAMSGRAELVSYLIGAGADIRARGTNDSTPLHLSARHPAVVRALIKAGADPNAADVFGQTPLWMAVGFGARESVSLLLAAGADPGRLDFHGRSIIVMARKSPDVGMTSFVLDLVEKAAAGGDASAECLMGYLHQTGSAVTQDYGRALEFYRRAAAQGHAGAQNNLGWMYQNGLGVEQNATEAVRWYRAAAKQQDPLGLQNLGVMYLNGTGVAADQDEALRLIRQSAELGHPNALVTLGFLFQDRGNQEESRSWHLRGAEVLHPQAFAALGELSLQGPTPGGNPVEAASWFLLGAAMGDESSRRRLQELDGRMTEAGQARAHATARAWQESWNARHMTDVLRVIPAQSRPSPEAPSAPARPSVTLEALTAAASTGDPAAQAALGERYLNGTGGAGKDAAAAAAWLDKAARRGAIEGQFWLGVLLARGEGLPKDYVQARAWFVVADRGGHPKAKDLIEGISAWMTPGQIADSERIAAEYAPAGSGALVEHPQEAPGAGAPAPGKARLPEVP